MKRLGILSVTLFLHLATCAMQDDTYPGAIIILPPTDSSHISHTGIPLETQISLQKSLTKKQLPNNHLIQAIEAIKSEHYEHANKELDQIKELTHHDAEALVSLHEALNTAFEKSDDQQENIWNNVDVIGIATTCSVLLDIPLRHLLPAPLETMCALYSSTAYLVYTCWRHAQQRERLNALEAYRTNITIAPPLYTIMLPPPQLVMEYPPSDKTHAPLERTEKSAYDGCRNRYEYEK